MMSVRREITVDASPEQAFAVFTERFDAWWPRSHHIGEPELREAILERREGGWPTLLELYRGVLESSSSAAELMQ